MATVPRDSVVSALLYDSSGNDSEATVDQIGPADLPDEQLLWVDIRSTNLTAVREVTDRLELPGPVISRLLAYDSALQLDNYGDFFSLAIVAIVASAETTAALKTARVLFLVGRTWLISIHDGPVKMVTGFRKQDKGDTNIGRLTPALLLSALLDWHLSAFLVEVSNIESEADRLDESILDGMETHALLTKMVRIRKRISLLRHVLSAQRNAIYGLSRPDFALVTGEESRSQMELIAARFDRAIDEIERSRDVIIGSFDLFTSLTAQKTNELVKALTYVTVVIGLCSAIAGLMGMNFDLPLFKTGMAGFLSVIAGLAIMIVLSFGWAKWRKWL
ncbi:MAG: CorA family divalent cation transporter [Novosphingobium sp.]